ncbi:hypothetical protein P167DRAFT_518728 [Morchella conica CCBAS932]|uniref:alpha-D-xyloside xylohydrolase n=1 Tax=Morchella conica CCBAS932 TaxID=1392247 RepID=A0A3N4KY68_9PEZI|nr:hypothetical protein P167DRAFT_518728 [Morchella conica CCBAS932]
MVKFSKGMWHATPDTIIRWATESVKAEALPESIRTVASSRAINHRGDTLNNPTLTITASSPSDDILLLSSYHWKAQRSTAIGPRFELYPDGLPERVNPVTTAKTDDLLTLTTGELTTSINIRPKSFNVDFKAGNKLLTKLGWRSIGYVQKGTDAHPNTELVDPDKGERWFTYQLQLGVGEKIYGLGERFGPFIKNGQTVELWHEDGGTSSELAYKNIPFYLSSAGYGIFIPTSAFVSYEIQSERTTRVNISVPGEALSMYLIYGPTPKDILSKYTLLTGRPALVPAWTFGLWLSTSFTTNYDEATVDSFLAGMKKREIPVGVFHYDCFWMRGFHWCDFEFDPLYFPDAKKQLKSLKDRGIKICVWINSYIAQESKIFDEGVEGGYFVKRPDGGVWQYDAWQAGMAFVDFTNPAACKWYQSKLADLVDLGVDVFKTDFGERIPTGNVVYHDGSDPELMHNYYTQLYNKTTFEILEKKLGPNNAALFARSATAGGQRFPVHWGGDPMSTYEAMAETLRGGLSLGLCGFGYWAHDIGGFEGKPDPGLFKRWIAFGCMSSHSRLHGSGSFRAPWLLDESGQADRVLRHWVNFKLSIMPYLYEAAIKAHTHGHPMMRPMFAEFPEDPITWHLDTQYMLGDNVLVAPVFNDEGDVEFYVPKGKWYGLLDHKIREGPGYFKEKHDFFSMPVLLRPGSAVLMGNRVDIAEYDWEDGASLMVNPLPGKTIKVNIPDWKKQGEIKSTVEVDYQDGQVSLKGAKTGILIVDVLKRSQ